MESYPFTVVALLHIHLKQEWFVRFFLFSKKSWTKISHKVSIHCNAFSIIRLHCNSITTQDLLVSYIIMLGYHGTMSGATIYMDWDFIGKIKSQLQSVIIVVYVEVLVMLQMHESVVFHKRMYAAHP